ncbi:uncharacterized protein LOC126996865 [Eriocheir sinensis]|uniref:uncharacterized protein LOC126996865 n=1 Tax=Eriocheir sinensis TaxID=95602 RepID=UPI0021C63107|nr:uncharacterized protein LOC126996865 [Eriocheir sinensis]
MSLRQDLVPSDWKMDCVTPIFKNYWSISLTSLVGYGNEDLRTPSPLIAIIRLRVALRERLADGDRAGRKHSRHRCPGGRTVIGAGFGDVWWWHGAAVVLWWRVLGLLRGPSDVASPQNLAQILKHFSELMETPVKKVINALVAECGSATGFFSLGLPGSSVPTHDSILATNTVTTSTDAKVQSPKMEVLGLCLGPCCRCGHCPCPCPCCSPQPVTSPS